MATLRQFVSDLLKTQAEPYALGSFVKDEDRKNLELDYRDLWARGTIDSDTFAIGSRHLTGSDYSGGALVRSNIRSAINETDESLRFEITGSHGSHSLYFLLDVDPDPEDAEESEAKCAAVVKLLRGLDNYPVVDDSDMSELEMEEANEAWQSTYESDFEGELCKVAGLDKGDLTFADGKSCELFHTIDNGRGLVEHTDEGACFDVERAAKETSPAIVWMLGTLDGHDFHLVRDLRERPDFGRYVERMMRIGSLLRGLNLPDDIKLSAKYDVGTPDVAELDALTIANVALRSFSATFRRWDGKELREVSATFDPFENIARAEYDAVRELRSKLGLPEVS